MPRAVLISPNPTGQTGGVERFCRLLARLFEAHGWTAVTIGPEVNLSRTAQRSGIGPAANAVSATRVARSLAPDLVISNGFLGGPCGCPRIHVFHGTMIQNVFASSDGSRRYKLRTLAGTAPLEAICGRGAYNVAVSTSTARELWQYYRQPVSAVIPNAVDMNCFTPGDRQSARCAFGLSDRGRYALFVGRFERRKGSDVVAEACARAGYDLLVAGPSAPHGAVTFGELSQSTLAHLYRAADCVLLPTRYEACSFVVIEALASGVPLLTTDTGWFADFLGQCPEYRRFLVTPSVTSIADALKRLDISWPSMPLSTARKLVEGSNSLEGFSCRWMSLIEQVMQ